MTTSLKMEEFDNFLVLLNSPGKKDYKKSFSLGVERLDKIDKIKYDPYEKTTSLPFPHCPGNCRLMHRF